MLLKSKIRSISNKPHPLNLPIRLCPQEDHSSGALPAHQGGTHQGPPVLHIDIPSDHKETTSIPDQSGSEEDVGQDGTADNAKTWQDADLLSSWDDYGLN